MILLQRQWQKLLEFLFPPETDTWLAVFRIGMGLQVVVYALFLKSDWHSLFSTTGKGVVSRELGEAMASFDSPLIPKLGWIVAFGQHVGLEEETVLSIAWACLFCMGCCLLLGLFCRPAAIIAWFLHVCAAESGGLLAYGADNFMTIALFYLMLSPLPDRYSLDRQLVKTQLKDPQLLGFWRRVLQVHLCFVYFFGGLAKLLGSGWWNGSNLWRALIRPPFNLLSPDILVRFRVRAADSRNFNLPDRDRLSGFYLDEKDPIFLVRLHFGNACRNRTDDGNVSVWSCNDCTQSGRVRRRH